jgi:3-oxoacyl-[acyl-carrier-protein] synthase II
LRGGDGENKDGPHSLKPNPQSKIQNPKLKGVVVTGMALLSCLGSLRESWQRLLAGESGIQRYQPFPELSPRPLGLIEATPTSLVSLVEQTAIAVLEDANLQPPLSNCGVVIGSSRSCQAVWEALMRERIQADVTERELFIQNPTDRLDLEATDRMEAANGWVAPPSICPRRPRHPPTSKSKIPNWLDTLPHQGAIAMARKIGATGPVLAPMAACASGIWAIARGFELIQTGECDRVLAGAVEAPITPLTLAGFEKMGALAKTGCYPFDKRREGLVLGEGAAVFILESAEAARRRKAKIYGQILGVGLTADGYHVSAPEIEGRSAIVAVKQCLQRSQLDFTDIDYIHAHGTSTTLNDKNEAQLIQHLFPQGVAVSSTKGATGHTLGASGAIGAAFCLMALKEQILPPCVGLTEPDFDLDFVREVRQVLVRNLLCLSFGFGGQNAVLALARV